VMTAAPTPASMVFLMASIIAPVMCARGGARATKILSFAGEKIRENTDLKFQISKHSFGHSYQAIMLFRTLLRIFPLLITATALLFADGCASRRDYVPEIDSKATPPPAMQGYGEFFAGKLMVEASLGRGFRMLPGRMKDYARRNRGGGGEGEDDDGNGFTDVYYIDQADAEQYFIPRMSNSTLPPIALRVRVTNQTQQPVEVEFLECNSPLGNFAVRPEKITLAAGATGSPDPMTSLLGVAGDEIQLKIGLRVGDAKETKTIILRTIKTAPPPQAPAK